ncbi:MAG: alpha-N-acetylglucosaminidase TIM-barrel domain-containing protein [Mucilaginibacter sp.]|uniref:alpha-N-acetylglucosaminidase n=1 Tax=Mucilaginibacter sp. TaxID=1882438 RepID=UPI0031A5348B
MKISAADQLTKRLSKIGVACLLAMVPQMLYGQNTPPKNDVVKSSRNVIERTFGKEVAIGIHIYMISSVNGNPVYEYAAANGELTVKGNSTAAVCKGFYDYLRTTNQGMVCWSGKNVHIQTPWLAAQKKRVTSPYHFHYYMNVVTHGYTTPYWGFDRWQQELDWMSLHGMDMPLINGAYEAIIFRVFKKLGLQDADIAAFFTGPAYHPWNRMGNITGWDAPVPASYYTKQIRLTHQVLDRMHELGMQPIIPAFAGFVPSAIKKVYPDAKVNDVIWGGFEKLTKYRAHILMPDNQLFAKIGTMYVQEWEKEFGKATYYLADSFNEMDVPPAPSEEQQLSQLSAYGNVVYRSIKDANPDAVWVMQGWTFPYQKGRDGKLFWTAERLGKLVEKVPDDKVMFLDLANEYNLDSWKIDPSWKTYKGFFNKAWIYSFIPNMGGKTPWNGILKTYAEAPETALNYEHKGNLTGFGFAPEGIENNEIIYELLSDIGYTDKKIDLKTWIAAYCKQRYGGYPPEMEQAFNNFQQSCYGTFEPHPRFRYQQNAKGDEAGSVNTNERFFAGVKQFLACAGQLKGSELYRNDAMELASQYLSLRADTIITVALANKSKVNDKELNKAYHLMGISDQLLRSHPNHQLKTWIDMAKSWGDTPAEKQYYARDAKRIITTWGGTVNDYSARTWSGLIDTYYIPRMKNLYSPVSKQKNMATDNWEENWIQRDLVLDSKPSADPVQLAVESVNSY